ncbi:S8 family serine peptidase [Streptomyces sp. MP131-18]|uniref:S8 family serine peptidase n=1 Tax=Streptomyces sp. MP131-18 TaxID=1857892 RepID=UPI00209AE028|nr:S8 family serine peptidase [Streptomyces sp. MP131-18]
MAIAATAAAMGAGLLIAPPAGADHGTTAPTRAPGQVTLVTGDRVALGADGEVLGVQRAEGRAHVPFSVSRGADGTFVVPSDARPLIAQGLVDPRLFDVTELSRPGYRRLAGDGVPVIVAYEGERPARLFDGGQPEIRADLDSIGAEALTLDADEAAAAWDALTGPRTLSSGVTSLTLDTVRRASLDTSVPQIGAPQAWEAGFDGSGVTVAVLDTGIDETHPDLDGGKVTASANFSEAQRIEDRRGHGTHVASILAGTGGTWSGVAPGARLLNGKVLDDYGYGFDSGIIAGMEWAVEQDADIVNMSLGGPDTPGVDPLEEAVNTLSAASGALFVVSAGNDGPEPGTLGSPGTADAALTVGAVDDADEPAAFSATGPRAGDAGLKPDLTAPGVDIGAAAAEGSVVAEEGEPVADGYVAISGTSMAAPHAAGAAALLAQAHPDWTGDRLKAALVASAEPAAGHGAFRQGAGRVDVARAVGQHIVAEPVSLGFGAVEWPHTEDPPPAEELTYRNLGPEDVTLELSLTGLAPDGTPAPDGMFSLDTTSVTVPASGTAAVTVTAATAAAGGATGGYSVYVTATGGEQTVRTAGGVELLGEAHVVTVEGIAADGGAPDDWSLYALDVATGESWDVTDVTGQGTRSVRLPADGDYLLVSSIEAVDGAGRVTDVAAQAEHVPDLAADATVVFDAAAAEPVLPTVPDAAAVPFALAADLELPAVEAGISWDHDPERATLHTGFAGPPLPDDQLHARIAGAWTAGDDAQYHVSAERAGSFFDGYAHAYPADDFAELSITQGALAEGTTGQLIVSGGRLASYGPYRDLPATTSLHVTRGSWDYALQFSGEGEAGWLGSAPRAYEPGDHVEHVVNVGVFGPALPTGGGVHRNGDTFDVNVAVLADGSGHSGYVDTESGATTLTRDGEVVHELDDYIRGWTALAVPPGEGRYELTTTARRPGAAVSTEVTVTFGFTSATVPGDEWAVLPTSLVRFAPRLDTGSTAPAGEVSTVPVSVEGAAAGPGTDGVTVEVSYDGGGTWVETPVADGEITVTNPAAGGTVSFRATVAGPDGSTTEQTVVDAYRTA